MKLWVLPLLGLCALAAGSAQPAVAADTVFQTAAVCLLIRPNDNVQVHLMLDANFNCDETKGPFKGMVISRNLSPTLDSMQRDGATTASVVFDNQSKRILFSVDAHATDFAQSTQYQVPIPGAEKNTQGFYSEERVSASGFRSPGPFRTKMDCELVGQLEQCRNNN